jgi:hypothetical protein
MQGKPVSRIAVDIVRVLLAFGVCMSQRPGGASRSSGEEVERPNVLLIVADDMGYTDVGVYGGETPTPHVDALAGEGVIRPPAAARLLLMPAR